MSNDQLRTNVNSAIADVDYLPRTLFVTRKGFEKMRTVISKTGEDAYFDASVARIPVVIQDKKDLSALCKKAGISGEDLDSGIVLCGDYPRFPSQIDLHYVLWS